MTICSVEGCPKTAWARGWCGAHYQRWHLHGDPLGSSPRARADCSVPKCDRKAHAALLCKTHLARMRRTGTTDAYRPVIERFDLFVDRRASNECWEWLGPRNNKNYGKIGLLYAHRVACEREPFALHSCDNPPCVNPAHLSWGTASRNGYERWARTGKRGLA